MSNELVPLSDIEKMGSAVATSGLFGLKTKEQAIALMLVAQALGKHPALAAMEYNIIQGKPSKKADAMLIDFQAAGGKVEWHTLTDIKADATFSHPSGGSLRLDWDIDRAKKAGLYDREGSMYKKYPRSMLRARLVVDGVRAVYPAATGGMRAPEEFDENEGDNGKSRVENIIDAQVEVIDATKEQKTTKEIDKPAEVAKATEVVKPSKKDKKSSDKLKVDIELPIIDGNTVMGLIEEIPKVATVEKDGKPAVKHSFKIGDLRYGTFDTDMAKKIMESIDRRSLVKFTYSERVANGKTFQDITSFEEVSADDIPI